MGIVYTILSCNTYDWYYNVFVFSTLIQVDWYLVQGAVLPFVQYSDTGP